MHTPETKQKFVTRRAQGHSFEQLAKDLGVAKSTLILWSRELRFEIQNQRVIVLDDLHERLLGNAQHRISQLNLKLAKVEGELQQRNLSDVPTAKLYTMAESLRRDIERLTQHSFISPIKDIPNAEFVDEVQEWKP
jgi:transposase-like protein